MDVPTNSGTLGPSPGRMIANPQARITPQKPQVATPGKGLQGGKKANLGTKMMYPSKLLKKNSKSPTNNKLALARKVQALKKKKKK